SGKGFYGLLIGGVLLMVLLSGCGGGGGSNDGTPTTTTPTTDTTTTIIKSDGGIANSSDGNLTLEIPSGAITEDVIVSIKKISITDAGVDESISLSEPYQLKIDPKSTKTAVLNKTMTDIGFGSIKVTLKKTKSTTNILAAKVGKASEIIAGTTISGTTEAVILVYSVAEGTVYGTVNIDIPLLDINLSSDENIILYDPTSLKEYTDEPILTPFTKQRQLDNPLLGNKTPVILIHGINRDENLKRTCNVDTPWCYKYKREVWDKFYSLLDDSFFNRFKVYEYIYPTPRSAEWSGQKLATMVKNNSELQGKEIFIVTHSMGGLVARYAMSYDESGNSNTGIGDNIKAVYTIATPHHGSPGASLLYINLVKFFMNCSSLGFSDGECTTFGTLMGATKGYYGLAAYTDGYLSLLWDNYDGGLTDKWIDIGTKENGGLKTFNQNQKEAYTRIEGRIFGGK
ncbi:MAG: hypothetical protein AAB257_01905, partial [Nitrospinota bacterium]